MAIFKECMHCVSAPSHSQILHLFQFAGEITNPHIYKFPQNNRSQFGERCIFQKTEKK